MTIRKDFISVEVQLNRLYEYSKVFHKNNIDKWPHLKNEEDFDRIFQLDKKDKLIFEQVYSVGRDCAITMSDRLQSFNYAEQHLTLTAFINSFLNGWVYQISELREILNLGKDSCAAISNCPWSVKEMLTLFNDQLSILSEIAKVLTLLKQSNLYKQENDITIKKGMTMTQKIGLIASIATIISTIVIFFPNDASSNQTSNGEQSPNIQTKNGNSIVTYNPKTTNNNYYINSKTNSLSLENSMLFPQPSVLKNRAKTSLCTVESGSKIVLLGEKKDPNIMGITWLQVKIISGTCAGVVGWTGKEKLVRK